jgi:hypothetical protein
MCVPKNDALVAMCCVVGGNPSKKIRNMTCFLEMRSLDPHEQVGLSHTIIEPLHRKSHVEAPEHQPHATYKHHIAICNDSFLPHTSKDEMRISKSLHNVFSCCGVEGDFSKRKAGYSIFFCQEPVQTHMGNWKRRAP